MEKHNQIFFLVFYFVACSLTFVWYHEQAHAVNCKISGGTPEITSNFPFLTVTTVCNNRIYEERLLMMDAFNEAVGYQLIPLYVFSLGLGVLIILK